MNITKISYKLKKILSDNHIQMLNDEQKLIHKLANAEWFSQVENFVKIRNFISPSMVCKCNLLGYLEVDYKTPIGVESNGQRIIALVVYYFGNSETKDYFSLVALSEFVAEDMPIIYFDFHRNVGDLYAQACCFSQTGELNLPRR